jgi:putative proteasome-type protease
MHEQSTNVNRMTYAVGVRLQRGLVFAADTRTNAGVDHVSQSRKLHFWRRTGDRVLVLLTAGNLAISQSVISIINEQLSPEAPTERPTLMNVSSMFRAARLIGDAMREVRTIDGPSLDKINTGFSVSCILGGQVGDEAPRLFQIYNEGNFIEATDDTPYLQIGEHKYGKPILDRVLHPEMRLGEVAKLILLSFDAIGMPIDLLLYERDTLDVRRVRRIDENDDYYRKLSSRWAEALRAAVASMDEYKG